jgi:glycerate dehydrogenase
VVTNKVPLTAAVLKNAPRLRCICIAATGSDNVDVAAANALGITVCNVRAYSTASVIQQTIGLLIALASKIVDYDNRIKQGAWVNAKLYCLQDYKTMELSGKMMGIVGYGAIGQGVAKVAMSLGMKIMIATRSESSGSHDGRIPLQAMLPQIDVLSLHCPLNDATHHMIGAKELANMKPGALLLNTSRGGLIDEKALVDALQNGHLGGAGLDVVSQEPPRKDSVLFSQTVPNLIMTPHVAWATKEARMRLLQRVADNVRGFLAGTPKNKIG